MNQTIWQNPRYGAINLIDQYEYRQRSPWYWSDRYCGGKGAKDNTVYFDIRYTLPGAVAKLQLNSL